VFRRREFSGRLSRRLLEIRDFCVYSADVQHNQDAFDYASNFSTMDAAARSTPASKLAVPTGPA